MKLGFWDDFGKPLEMGMFGGGVSDTTAPTVTGFSATTPSGLTIAITAFTASEAGASFLITESATPPLPGAAGWSGTAPTTYAVTTYATHTLYPWVKDSSDNVSSVYGSPASVVVTYQQQLINLYGADYQFLYPLSETSGTQANDVSGKNNHGTYHNVTLNQTGMGDGNPSILIGAPSSGSDVAGNGTGMNWKELTVSVWIKMTWDTTRRGFFELRKSSSYIFYAEQPATGSIVSTKYTANGTTTAKEFNYNNPNWFQLTVTISYANQRMRVYINGIQQGADIAGITEWVDNPPTTLYFGREATAGREMSGNLQYAYWVNREATPEEVAASFFPS